MATKPSKRRGWEAEKAILHFASTEYVKVWKVDTPRGIKTYDKKSDYDSAWDNFSTKWDECEKVAQMIQKCHELEQECAIIYGIIGGMQESISLSINNLASALNNTRGGIEKHLDDAKSVVGECKTDLDAPLKKCKESIKILDKVNESLGKMGNEFTQYHNNTIFPAYKSACDAVGEEYTKFIE